MEVMAAVAAYGGGGDVGGSDRDGKGGDGDGGGGGGDWGGGGSDGDYGRAEALATAWRLRCDKVAVLGARGTPGVSATEAASEAANNVTEKAETPASASDPRWRLRICSALALRMGTEQNGQCHGLRRVTRQTRGMAQSGEVHMAWHSRAIIHLGRGRSHALVAIRLMRKPQAV